MGVSSAKPSMMMLLLLLCMVVFSPCGTCGTKVEGDVLGSECLKVSTSEFVGSVRTVIDVLQQVASILSGFGSAFGDSRLSNAVSDCLDLLDLSSDELTWSASASQNPKGTYFTLFPLFRRNRGSQTHNDAILLLLLFFGN